MRGASKAQRKFQARRHTINRRMHEIMAIEFYPNSTSVQNSKMAYLAFRGRLLDRGITSLPSKLFGPFASEYAR